MCERFKLVRMCIARLVQNCQQTYDIWSGVRADGSTQNIAAVNEPSQTMSTEEGM